MVSTRRFVGNLDAVSLTYKTCQVPTNEKISHFWLSNDMLGTGNTKSAKKWVILSKT